MTKISNVVTPTGGNKYWSSRVSEKSDYKVPGLGITYGTNINPFGSILAPEPTGSPEEWFVDTKPGSSVKGRYPLRDVNNEVEVAGAGAVFRCVENKRGDCSVVLDASEDPFPYKKYSRGSGGDSIDLLKRLFAKSYGAWFWDNYAKRYVKQGGNLVDVAYRTVNQCVGGVVNEETCNLDNNDCPGGSCTGEVASVSYNDYICQGTINSCCPADKIVENVLVDSCAKHGLICNEEFGVCENAQGYQFPTVGSCAVTTGKERGCEIDVDVVECESGVVCGLETVVVAEHSVCEGGANHGRVCVAHDCGGGSCETLFVEDLSAGSGSSLYWGPPGSNGEGAGENYGKCPDSGRPEYDSDPSADYCAIAPVIRDIKVDGESATSTLKNAELVNLTFNSDVDDQQLPLVSYTVDWGDGEKTSVSGAGMLDKPNEDNFHSLYYLYSYWDLLAKRNELANDPTKTEYRGIYCADGGGAIALTGESEGDAVRSSLFLDYASVPSGRYCAVRPKVKIRDNWGWCNGGSSINDCDKWERFETVIIVTEK